MFLSLISISFTEILCEREDINFIKCNNSLLKAPIPFFPESGSPNRPKQDSCFEPWSSCYDLTYLLGQWLVINYNWNDKTLLPSLHQAYSIPWLIKPLWKVFSPFLVTVDWWHWSIMAISALTQEGLSVSTPQPCALLQSQEMLCVPMF